jgi:hypothetical protein
MGPLYFSSENVAWGVVVSGLIGEVTGYQMVNKLKPWQFCEVAWVVMGDGSSRQNGKHGYWKLANIGLISGSEASKGNNMASGKLLHWVIVGAGPGA